MAQNKWMSFFENYSTTSLTTAQLRQAEKSLAKQTNQRLVRLEQRGNNRNQKPLTLPAEPAMQGLWL